MKRPFTETHWVCACVKRDRNGTMKAIKLHPLATKACRVCGVKQPTAKGPNTKLSGGGD